MKQILIKTDSKMIAEFRTDVQDTCDRCNELIETFEIFQSWSRIETVDDFVRLATDPKKTFDDCIIKNVQIPGTKKVNPEVAADLLDIKRSEFLNITAGISIIDDDCIPCKQSKIRKGKRSVHVNEFNQYSQYMDFSKGRFSVNPSAVEEHIKKFSFYASTDKEIETYKHFQNLVELLNKHSEKYFLNNSEKEFMKRSLHLSLTEGISGKFMMNIDFVTNEILKLRSIR